MQRFREIDSNRERLKIIESRLDFRGRAVHYRAKADYQRLVARKNLTQDSLHVFPKIGFEIVR